MTADNAEGYLSERGISIAAAEAAGMYFAESAKDVNDDFQDLPAIVIPYWGVEGFARVRYLAEPPRKRSFVKHKTQRYAQPKDSGVYAYFPQCEEIDWTEVIEDVETPIVITEGEIKSLRACLCGIPTIGLGGVYNFMRGDNLLPELDAISFDGRSVYILFDSDAVSNTSIQAAEGRLATELSLKRGADVFLARIPKLPGQDKTGLDDLYVAKGADAIFKVLEKAPQMRKLDAAVLGLNKSVAWIEREGLVYDTDANEWIKKHDFTSGSKYSALEVLVPTLKGTGLKRLSVAGEFLVHPLARRYSDVVFRPDTQDKTINTPSGLSLNLWRGWDADEGDVEPFLDLSAFLFSELPDDQQDLALRLIAYKAQNPGEKIPLALVLLGTQGCGKSFWSQIVREAFAPYGVSVNPRALVSDFNGWTEKSLIAVLDEARGVDVSKGAETLKSLISETKTYMNEKYRQARQIDSYTMYILTSNDRRVGSYSTDDRRMFVVSCPPKREKAFYDRIRSWRDDNGPKKLLGWLLDLDLEGWRPPAAAPMTAEKYMAYMESLTPIQRLAEDMLTSDDNVVKSWIDSALMWANQAVADERHAARAKDIKDAMGRIQIRPFYTPEELTMMFPAIAAQLHGHKASTNVAGEISRQLRECGIPHLQNTDDPKGFRWRGMLRQYLIVSKQDDWPKKMSQDEFDRAMKNFPDYGTVVAGSK